MHWTEQLFLEQAETYIEFFEDRYDQADVEVDQLLQLIEDERGVTPECILDTACGSGRHALAFAEKGYSVEGFDFSEEFIDRAQIRATEEGLSDQVDFYVHDMRDLDEFHGSFDIITNFWNSMGYYDKATDVEMLSEMNHMLTDEGVVVIETGNKDHYLKNFESASVNEGDDQLYLERREYIINTGKFRTTLDLFSITDTGYRHRETMEWEQRQYAPVEWLELCETAGFKHVSLFGGFDGGPLSLDSETVIVLAG